MSPDHWQSKVKNKVTTLRTLFHEKQSHSNLSGLLSVEPVINFLKLSEESVA